MDRFTGINPLAMATADMDQTIRYWRDLLGTYLFLYGCGDLVKDCQHKKTGSPNPNDNKHLGRCGPIFCNLIKRVGDKTAHHHAQSLIDPCCDDNSCAAYPQGVQITPGRGNNQENERYKGERRRGPHPGDKLSVALIPGKKIDPCVHMTGDIAVKGREKFKEAKEHVQNHGICHNSAEGSDLLLAGIKIGYLSDNEAQEDKEGRP